MLSERVAAGLPEPPGRSFELELKGKGAPQRAYLATL